MKKMDYQTASRIRKTGWADLFADQLSDPSQTIGGAISKTFSLKTKAFDTGIKQKFDPLNIARFLTGGSAIGPALLGKLTGRSARDISFFTGRYRPIRSADTVSKLKPLAPVQAPQKVSDDQSGMLNKIYQLMRESQFRDMKRRNKEINFLEEKELEAKRRHDEYMKELQKFLNVPSIFVFEKKEEEQGLLDNLWSRIKDLLAALGLSKAIPSIPTPGDTKKGGGKPSGPVPAPTPGPGTPNKPEAPPKADKLATLKKIAPILGAASGPAIVAAGVAGAIYETSEYKKEIEADPFNPKFDNIPYAMVLRGEAKTVKQAGEMNRKKALKTMPRNQVEELVKNFNTIEIFDMIGTTRNDLQDWLKKNPEPSAMFQLPEMVTPQGPTEEQLVQERLAEEDRLKLIQQGSKPAFVAPKSGIRKKPAPVSRSTPVPNVEKATAMVRASMENSQLNLPKPVEDIQTQINNVSTASPTNTGTLLNLSEVGVRNTEDTFRRLIVSNTRVV